MKKITCVIDACSYIYLNLFSIPSNDKDKTLFDFLEGLVIIKNSQEVNREIIKHFNTATFIKKIRKSFL